VAAFSVFFFQAEDGIRDRNVTGVQTCALPILLLIGYFVSEFINLPVSIVAGIVAIFFLIIARNSEAVDTKSVVTGAPWDIVFFSIGMYVVVFGLRNAGLTDVLARVIEASAE